MLLAAGCWQWLLLCVVDVFAEVVVCGAEPEVKTKTKPDRKNVSEIKRSAFHSPAGWKLWGVVWNVCE